MRQIQLSSFATAVVLAVGVGTAAHAAERATPREARTMFEQAVRYMEQNGAERAFALGFAAEIADDDHLVDRSSHQNASFSIQTRSPSAFGNSR